MKYYRMILPYVIGAATLVPNTSGNKAYANDINDKDYDKITNVMDSVNIAAYDTAQTVPDAVPVRVEEHGLSVIYIYSDGSRVIRKGGTRAWRNNNPGNLHPYPFAFDNNAIGTAGKHAVFPDEETGMRALCALLQTESYRNRTIQSALKRYCPPNWQKYTRNLTRITGLSANTKLSQLTSVQLDKVAKTIRRLEGWIPGEETKIQAPQYAMMNMMQQKVR